MIDQKNFLQASCSSQPYRPVAKILPSVQATYLAVLQARRFAILQAKSLTVSLLPPTALLMLVTAPLNALAQTPPAQTSPAQTCAAFYEPGTQLQRRNTGLFDGRVGLIKIVNNTENATVISLYHPDAPKQVFKYWYAEPGKSYWLGTDPYSSDWGIQVDEGPICLVGRVASWDGYTFTTFPSRLFIVDTPIAAVSPSLGAIVRSSQAPVALTPSPQPPVIYEAIALQQLTKGDVRSGLISLLRAADLYRASGQTKEEKRVRDRIQQIRGS